MALLCLGWMGCGDSDDDVIRNADANPGEELVDEEGEEGEPADYHVFLSGALVDTLSGDAIFGEVWNPVTREHRLIIELVVGRGPGSGMYISQNDMSPPEPGTYSLAPQEGQDAAPEGTYAISYREGLLRIVTSRAGTLTIEEVTDSTITGQFDAELFGEVVRVNRNPGVLPYQGPQVLNAEGTFEAHRGTMGYVVGID